MTAYLTTANLNILIIQSIDFTFRDFQEPLRNADVQTRQTSTFLLEKKRKSKEEKLNKNLLRIPIQFYS